MTVSRCLAKFRYASLGAAGLIALAALPAQAGTLYADTNSTLYTVNESTGALTQVATGFSQARGIAFDSSGTVYVADFGAGSVSTIVGGNAVALITGLPGAYGLAFTPTGNLLVSTDGGTLKTYTTAGALLSSLTIGGNLTDLGYAANGDLLVSSRNTGGVGLVTNVTANSTFANIGSNSGFPNAARGITTVGGNTFVSNSTGINGATGSVFEFDSAGNLIATLFNGNAEDPKGSVYDPATGLIYYAGAGGNGGVSGAGGGVYSFDPTSPGSSPTALTVPGSVSFQEVALASSIPEPGSMLLVGTAVVGLARLRRSRGKTAAA